MERDRCVVPAGREFLCRRDILGVPGVLDGLSHVVSERGRKRGRKTMTLGEEHQLCSCYFVNSIGTICGQQ